MIRQQVVFSLALLWTVGPVFAGDGQITKAIEEIQRDDRTDSPDDCSDDVGLSIAGSILGALFSGKRDDSGDVYQLVEEDDYEPRGARPYFYRFPYAGGTKGYMNFDGWEYRETLKTASLQTAIEYGNNFDGLERWTGRALLDTSGHWGFQADWSYYQESTSRGVDELLVGDFNLMLRLSQTENVQLRVGVGPRTLTDGNRSFWGVNFTCGADVFLARPLVLSGSYDVGTSGSSTIHHGRLLLGAIWNRFELFTGYDYLSIGTVGLHGPTAGLRIWW